MNLLFATLLLVIIYFAQKKIYKKLWNKNLDAEISFSKDYIECGESAELVEVVSNDKFLPLPVFHLKFSVDKSLDFVDKSNSQVTDRYHKNEVFSIMGHERITRKLVFMGSNRGVVNVSNASILVHDFFMTGTYARPIDHSDVIYVFPKKLNTEKFRLLFRGIIGEIESPRSLVEDPLVFRGVREYQPFDPYRSINWKQSAKARELMVNMYGFTTDSRVRIMLNLDNDYMIETNKLLEEAISLASTFSRMLLEQGVGVSMVTNAKGRDGKTIPDVGEGYELSHSVKIDKYLAEIKGSEGKEYFLYMLEKELSAVKKNVLYLVISPYAKPDLIELLDAMETAKASVHLLVPFYDEYPFRPNRHYADGWEVPINV